MEIIKTNNGFIETDHEGYFLNPTDQSLLQSQWKPAIQDLVEIFIGYYSKDIHSIYLRGSAARGKAIENISDIDLIIVVNNKVNRSVVNDDIKNLENKYPFITKFETQFILLEDLTNKEKLIPKQFTIAVQSLCVYGDNIQSLLPKFKPDENLSQLYSDNMALIFKRVENTLKNAPNENEIRILSIWVMKRILRNGFLLIMPKVKKFTRDLYLCYEELSRFYPDKEHEIREALEISVNGTTEIDQINRIINNLGNWVRVNSIKAI